DSTVCSVRFAGGAVANVASTCCSNAIECFVVELSGRDFYLKLTMDTLLKGQSENQPIDFTGKETGYFRQVEHFIQAVEKGDQRLVRSSYEDAARSLALTFAATRSIETGKVEKVPAV